MWAPDVIAVTAFTFIKLRSGGMMQESLEVPLIPMIFCGKLICASAHMTELSFDKTFPIQQMVVGGRSGEVAN